MGCCYSCSLSGGFCATPVDKAANLKKKRRRKRRRGEKHACVLFSQPFGKLDDDLVKQNAKRIQRSKSRR